MTTPKLIRGMTAALALLALPALEAAPLKAASTDTTELAADTTRETAADTTKQNQPVRLPGQGLVSNHVVVISVDGLRPDAIEAFGAETIQRLMREGSYSLEARTIMPSRTLPSHTSMLTGEDVTEHGITFNSQQMEEHGHVATPTIFAAARQAGFRTAAFFSKEKFQHLAVPGTLDYFQAPDGGIGKWMADRTVDDVEEYLEWNTPNLLFVHIGEPDFAGHLLGWMSEPYGWAVREADSEIGELLEAAERAFGAGNYTVILTADHGGHGRDHGTSDARDVTIPWVAWGRGVQPGTVLGSGIRTMDTAATALWLLGLSEGFEGQPVQSAFAPIAGGPVMAAH